MAGPPKAKRSESPRLRALAKFPTGIRKRRRKVIDARTSSLQLYLGAEDQPAQQMAAQVAMELKQADQRRAGMAWSRSVRTGSPAANGKSALAQRTK
jgi:hypothetical protein